MHLDSPNSPPNAVAITAIPATHFANSSSINNQR